MDYDQNPLRRAATPRIDAKVLRHMMLETVDLLDASSDHADEACESTDAAMALTRIDWMLMAVFNWLTYQLRIDGGGTAPSVGKPVSVIGIDQDLLSDELRAYAGVVDRLHARIHQLELLTTASAVAQPVAGVPSDPAMPCSTGVVLNIFGDPDTGTPLRNEVRASQSRLISAFAGQ